MSIAITRGDKERFEAVVSEFSGDLSAVTTLVQFTAKYSPDDDDADAVILLTKDSGRIVVDSATELSWYVSADDYDIPKLRSAIKLHWDLQLIDETETPPGVYTLKSGTMPVKPDVSLSV